MGTATLTEVLTRLTQPTSRKSINGAILTGAIVGALSAAWVVRDFSEWKGFGTGGTPATWRGYWRMTQLRLRRALSRDSMRDAGPLDKDGKSNSYLASPLPTRQHPRPEIMSRTMPHRQKPEVLDPEVQSILHETPRRLAEANPDILVLELSKTEGRSTDAIYAKPGLAGRDPAAQDRILGDEIAHVHPADNSLHVWLSEADAATVTARGWGERFPLGALGMCHAGWVMVYAPKTKGDLDVIESIIKAGVAFLTGEKI